MARGARIPLDAKIEKAQAKVDRAQEALNKAKAELKALEDKKDSAKRDEVVDFIMNSGKSLDEIKELFSAKEN